MITYRSVPTVVILTIVTCGIYGLYWVYTTLEELETVTGNKPSGIDAIVILLLALFFSPVGYLLYGMAADEQLNMLRVNAGIPEEDNKVLYMILGFFIPIVLIPIVQNELNRFATVQE